MYIDQVEIGRFFAKATSVGKKNAQIFRMASAGYYNGYVSQTLYRVNNIKKGTTLTLPSGLKVIPIQDWTNPVELYKKPTQ